ncbi:MAG: hypothetical protein FJ301_03570 [Planctomycetes bacterium]|nr:hypothetical protein [Planctomycetota bacterium]
MNLNLVSVAAFACGALLSAQSPLNVYPVAPVGYYGWNAPPAIHSHMFDLTVTSQVTLQAINTPLLSPLGQQGTFEVWLTNPGITTYVGSETNSANWTLQSSGRIFGKGTTGSLVTLSALTCQQTPAGAGLVLSPGSRGVLLRYVGVTPLLVATTPQTFTNAEISVSGGSMQYTPWGAPQGAIGGTTGYTSWGWRGQIIYANGTAPHACAETATYGEGCYTVNGSAYQEWTDNAPGGAAAAASLALTGKSLKFLPTGPSYLMLPGTAAGYVAPSATATALALTDDNEVTVALTVPFNYAGGTTNNLFVHANGYVSVATNNTLPGGPNYVPEIPAMLSATETAWWSWHDYNPTEAGSGQVKFEEVGGVAYITWDGVESYPTTQANPSTLQFQFNLVTGEVNIVWQTIESFGQTGFLQGSDHIIGFSPGGNSPATGLFNINTLTSQLLSFPEVFPLNLVSSSNPLIGTTVNLVTSRETGSSLGICFVTTGQIAAPGLDLGLIGAPGCSALVDISTGVGNLISNLGLPGVSMSIAFPLPNNPAFAGLSVFSQSIWLDPTVNAFGMLVSNGVDFTLGNF